MKKCLDTAGRSAGEAPGLFVCHGKGGNQVCFPVFFFRSIVGSYVHFFRIVDSFLFVDIY